MRIVKNWERKVGDQIFLRYLCPVGDVRAWTQYISTLSRDKILWIEVTCSWSLFLWEHFSMIVILWIFYHYSIQTNLIVFPPNKNGITKLLLEQFLCISLSSFKIFCANILKLTFSGGLAPLNMIPYIYDT